MIIRNSGFGKLTGSRPRSPRHPDTAALDHSDTGTPSIAAIGPQLRLADRAHGSTGRNGNITAAAGFVFLGGCASEDAHVEIKSQSVFDDCLGCVSRMRCSTSARGQSN
jgi:hypothetical protein